ncbi:hypothetical protein ABT127_34605 [Streptomyces sp. NPDC001904]|uniref:hypothetical protein n=1 Tax=Streptomyces sp. NPDC001904 TaxID=3154531 RepID=UPI00331C58E8
MQITHHVPLGPVTVSLLAPGDCFSVAVPNGAPHPCRPPFLNIVEIARNATLPGYTTVSTTDGPVTLPCDLPITPHTMTRSLPVTCAECGTVEWLRRDLALHGVPALAVCSDCAQQAPGPDPSTAEGRSIRTLLVKLDALESRSPEWPVDAIAEYVSTWRTQFQAGQHDDASEGEHTAGRDSAHPNENGSVHRIHLPAQRDRRWGA